MDHSVRGHRGRIDIAFTRLRVAVFVDGCFWHGCPRHGSIPASNRGWWTEKIRGNQQRDARATERLQDLGWSVVRIWEHVPADEAAEVVVAAIEEAATRPPTPNGQA